MLVFRVFNDFIMFAQVDVITPTRHFYLRCETVPSYIVHGTQNRSDSQTAAADADLFAYVLPDARRDGISDRTIDTIDHVHNNNMAESVLDRGRENDDFYCFLSF